MPSAESVRVPSRSKITSCGGVAAAVSSRVVTRPLSLTAHYCRDVASPKLLDVIDVLEAAYPPALAQDWDSVGLVCGDPGDVVDTVTIAVDATATVVDEVPDRGLLLAHHPLLLRGVDTVAADTAKGALLHRMIRSG